MNETTENNNNNIIEIIFNDIRIYLPMSASAVATARKLLDLFEQDVLKNQIAGTPKYTQPIEVQDAIKIQEAIKNTQGLSEDDPAKVTSDNFIFVFKDCEPFECSHLPTSGAGKTVYHVDGDRVHIMRDGYKSCSVFCTLESLKYLKNHPSEVNKALKGMYDNKKFIIKGFLRDIDFDNIMQVEKSDVTDGKAVEPHEPPTMSERTKRLQEVAKINQKRWAKIRQEKEGSNNVNVDNPDMGQGNDNEAHRVI